MESHPLHFIIQDYIVNLKTFYELNKSYTLRKYNIRNEAEYEDFIKNTLGAYEEFSYKLGLNKKGHTIAQIIYDSECWSYNKHLVRVEKVRKDMLKFSNIMDENQNENWVFITIGWNEQEVTPKLMQKASANIASLKYFISVKYVLEKHRENGIHHHTHFLVKFNEKLYKSKLIDWLYQTKGVKAICLGKNFIDIKGPLNKKKPYQTLELYENYVNGIKKDEKQKYIDLDKKWRAENSLEDLYEISNC